MLKNVYFVFIMSFLLGSSPPDKLSSNISIIPRPVSVQPRQGSFQLTTKTVIELPTDLKQGDFIGSYLKKKLADPTGFYSMSVTTSTSGVDSNRIVLTLANDTTGFGNREGYHLNVSSRKIEIKAPTSHGLFYGVQSLLQLFPAQIEQADYTLVPQDTQWIIPAVAIQDYPRFPYRGMHLDVGRHFRKVEFIKKYIDWLAKYKMNRFHWHLTEDQGWRIQIKKYPKLTQIGAWRDSTIIGHNNSSGPYKHQRTGGFYTQKQIREIVTYAKKRSVTIIPEIEMPGHSSAALAAYPKLGCSDKINYHVRSQWGIFKDIYCPSEYTFTFLENVLKEVMDLFPGKYIHIGGDEAPKDAWKKSELAQKVIKREGLKNEDQLQSYFIGRIEKFLKVHGRNTMGWIEILEGGLTPNATVMSWHGNRGNKKGIEAARKHHNVIMVPNNTNYLNFYQANSKTEPIAQERFTIPLKKVYEFDPVPQALTKRQAKYIKGTQGCLWGEYIGSHQKAEYMLFPRMVALSEVAWSPKKERNWSSFWKRLQPQFKRFDVSGINYATHYKGQEPNLE